MESGTECDAHQSRCSITADWRHCYVHEQPSVCCRFFCPYFQLEQFRDDQWNSFFLQASITPKYDEPDADDDNDGNKKNKQNTQKSFSRSHVIRFFGWLFQTLFFIRLHFNSLFTLPIHSIPHPRPPFDPCRRQQCSLYVRRCRQSFRNRR